MQPAFSRTGYLDSLLAKHLRNLLGDDAGEATTLLQQHLEWVELPGGSTLMQQGESGDAMYIIVSGRLRTYITDEDGDTRMVRELARGEVVGEMALYTDEPRSATLVAIRDSVLVRLDKAQFNRLLATSGQVSIALTRRIIQRLQTEGGRRGSDRPAALGLLPISANVDARAFARQLALALGVHGRVALVDAESLDAELGEPGISHRDQGDVEANRRIAVHLDEIEAGHDFVLLVSDATPTSWTQRCSRHCDEIYLLADADAPPEVHPTEARYLVQRPARTDAAEILLLLHPPGRRMPGGTAAWLARRPLAGHLHLRRGLDRDMARLARLISRQALGLVLAGGGARGLAHLGVLRALREQGLEVDVVGGTSIGAVMAFCAAVDQPQAEVVAATRKAFLQNPTGDFNLLPLMALIKGRRLRRVVSEAMTALAGDAELDLEDLWKTCYVVATNYSQAGELVITRGPAMPAMLASIAIPGALPPVIRDGDLLCDGGTFNNFPVDVMRGMRGVGRVVGVDLSFRKPRKLALAEVPGSWQLLLDRLRPRRQRRYKLPTLAAFLMNVTILYSVSRQRQAKRLTDVYLNPPLDRVGMLQWHRFDQIVEQGHAHAREVLAAAAGAAAVPGDD